MRKFYLILFFGLFLFFYLSCDGPFPSQTKPTVPSDHTSNFGGVLHAGEREGSESECEECHGSDLHGGVKLINGVWTYSPSCYQCHGNVWERTGGGK